MVCHIAVVLSWRAFFVKTVIRDWNIAGISQSQYYCIPLQTDGLVKMFNRTLIEMFDKTAKL